MRFCPFIVQGTCFTGVPCDRALQQKRYPLTGWPVVSPFRVYANHLLNRWFWLCLSESNSASACLTLRITWRQLLALYPLALRVVALDNVNADALQSVCFGEANTNARKLLPLGKAAKIKTADLPIVHRNGAPKEYSIAAPDRIYAWERQVRSWCIG